MLEPHEGSSTRRFKDYKHSPKLAARCRYSSTKKVWSIRYQPRGCPTGACAISACLAVLCHPTPPPVVCIEEPEIGLHPDVIPEVAKLLVEASSRAARIFVTTHSDILVDALTDVPEAVIVCEKSDGATQLRRLDAEELKPWLEKYRLGELWTKGRFGGNRW